MRRRDFLLSLATLPFLPDASPVWNGTIGTYVGETVFYSARIALDHDHDICVKIVDIPFTSRPLVVFSKFKDVSMGCKT